MSMSEWRTPENQKIFDQQNQILDLMRNLSSKDEEIKRLREKINQLESESNELFELLKTARNENNNRVKRT